MYGAQTGNIADNGRYHVSGLRPSGHCRHVRLPHVTQQELGGLFGMIAIDEKRIRENSIACSSELLQKVFGSVSS